MYPLQLSINPEGWRIFVARKADKAFQLMQNKVFARDHYSCQFCGFQAHDYQEVVNLDGNYRNNQIANMVTACCFCAQCYFIEAVGQSGYGGGRLIYLPEMTQPELNSFCHVMFCAMTNGTNYQGTAQNIYRSLKFRTQPVEDKFGVGMSNPNLFGQILIENDTVEQKETLTQILKNLRLLPSYARFRKQLGHWAAAAAEELATKKHKEAS